MQKYLGIGPETALKSKKKRKKSLSTHGLNLKKLFSESRKIL